jgi:hypothetical protein
MNSCTCAPPCSFTVPYDGSGGFENFGVCHDCGHTVAIESVPSSNVYGRHFWKKATPEQRAAGHPANLPSKYVEVRPGWYDIAGAP